MAFCHNLARDAEQDLKDSHWDRQEMLNKCREECQEESTFDPFDYQPFYLDPDDSLDDDWPGYEYFGHREY